MRITMRMRTDGLEWDGETKFRNHRLDLAINWLCLCLCWCVPAWPEQEQQEAQEICRK